MPPPGAAACGGLVRLGEVGDEALSQGKSQALSLYSMARGFSMRAGRLRALPGDYVAVDIVVEDDARLFAVAFLDRCVAKGDTENIHVGVVGDFHS